MSTSRSELALYPVQGTRPTTSAKIVPNLFNPRSVHGGSCLRVTLQPLGKFTWLSRPIRPSVVWVTVTPMLAITQNKLLSLNGSFLLVNHCMLWGINTDLGEVVEVHRWEPSFRWGGCGERSIGKGLAYVRWLGSKKPRRIIFAINADIRVPTLGRARFRRSCHVTNAPSHYIECLFAV